MKLVLIAFWCVVFPVISAFCCTLGVDISYKCVKIIYIDKFLRIIVNRIRKEKIMDVTKYFDPKKVDEDMNTMNAFGIRLTGSDAQNEFCEWIKAQIANMGLQSVVTPYTFKRWEAKNCSLVVDGKPVHVSSPFPYSGLTSEKGVSGKLVVVGNHPLGFQRARGKIAVCRIKNLSKISSKIAFDKRKSLPSDLEIEKSYRGPVSTSFVKTLLTFWAAQLSGMKGMICIWEDMSDQMVEGQVLNFILHYLKVPMVWVNQTDGKAVLEAAKAKKSATLTLEGTLENAKTQSFYTVIKGKKETNEAIIINTHTDGCNFCEENGAIGLLRMMEYFTKHPTDRNLVFAFVTGHFRLPSFRTGTDQATSKFLADNKQVWNGKKGGLKAVAGCAVEHLGCTEWKDVDGVYTQTNPVDVEIVYTGNKTVDDIYYEAIKERDVVRTMTLRGHNMLHFGEGQPLFNKHIPEIALVTAPDYLCSIADNHHMDKYNSSLACEQICTFIRCVELLDKKSAKELGKAQGYSIGLGKLK